MVVTIGVFLLRTESLEGAYEVIRTAEAADDVRTALVARGATIAVLDWRGEWEALERDASEALELATRMGAARFEAAAVPHLGVAMAAQGRVEQARATLRTAYAKGHEAGLAFYGPIILGVMALVTDEPERRRELLDEAQQLLEGGCVSHNYLRFYPYGMYVAWALGDADRLERYADALEAYAAAEPLPWTELFVPWGRTLARALRGEVDAAALRALRERVAEQELSLAAAPLDVLLGSAETAPFTRGSAR